MSHQFYIVDVFAETKYAGNQLAVVRGAQDLSGEQMQQLALELNYSETSFILSDDQRQGGYDVRIFTASREVPFAGHPTLGSAYIIQQEILRAPVERITLNLQVGQVPVTFAAAGQAAEVLWMRQIAPQFGLTRAPALAAEALGLELAAIDERFPVQEVSTGLPFMLVPLKSLDAVRRAVVNHAALKALLSGTAADALLVFAPETYQPENQINARVFIDANGLPEDPATGSANGCLAAYLVRYRYFGSSEVDLRVEQGYEIQRPALLRLRAAEQHGSISITIGGRVFLVAKGELV